MADHTLGIACVPTRAQQRDGSLRAAEELARDQNGVLSRAQLRDFGVNRHVVRSQVRARRWAAHGLQTIAVHTADLDRRARWWSALFEVGAGGALDGVTALHAAGLTGYDEPAIHVSTPQGTNPPDPSGVVVHETKGRHVDDLVGAGIPRTRPEVAPSERLSGRGLTARPPSSS